MTLLPYATFDRQLDRLFEDALGKLNERQTTWSPRVNIYEDEQGLNLEASLPGMNQKDIEVLVEDGVLTIRGQRKEEKTETSRDYLVREMASGEFSRSFTLPNYVDQNRAAASYRNGVLTVQFPKREEAKPRRVMIESK